MVQHSSASLTLITPNHTRGITPQCSAQKIVAHWARSIKVVSYFSLLRCFCRDDEDGFKRDVSFSHSPPAFVLALIIRSVRKCGDMSY